MNDLLRKCPRCGRGACECDERMLANALSGVGTGACNIDVMANHRWSASLRRYNRTAFIELKQAGEDLRIGQSMCMHDLTGRLASNSGVVFDQRAFLVRRDKNGALLLQSIRELGERGDPWRTILAGATWTEIAARIREWLETGVLTIDLELERAS